MAQYWNGDLSIFANGDSCRVSGYVGDYNGAPVPEVSFNETFTWSSSSNVREYYGTGTYSNYAVRITLTSTQVVAQGGHYLSGQWSWTSGYMLYNFTVYWVPPSPWSKVSRAFKKQNGVWVEVTDMSQVFDPNVSYQKGN